MLSDYDKLLVTGRNPIREKQGQVRKPVGRDLIVKMGAKRILVADTGEEFRRSFIETVASEPDIHPSKSAESIIWIISGWERPLR